MSVVQGSLPSKIEYSKNGFANFDYHDTQTLPVEPVDWTAIDVEALDKYEKLKVTFTLTRLGYAEYRKSVDELESWMSKQKGLTFMSVPYDKEYKVTMTVSKKGVKVVHLDNNGIAMTESHIYPLTDMERFKAMLSKVCHVRFQVAPWARQAEGRNAGQYVLVDTLGVTNGYEGLRK